MGAVVVYRLVTYRVSAVDTNFRGELGIASLFTFAFAAGIRQDRSVDAQQRARLFVKDAIDRAAGSNAIL
jgi:hypothetical protein